MLQQIVGLGKCVERRKRASQNDQHNYGDFEDFLKTVTVCHTFLNVGHLIDDFKRKYTNTKETRELAKVEQRHFVLDLRESVNIVECHSQERCQGAKVAYKTPFHKLMVLVDQTHGSDHHHAQHQKKKFVGVGVFQVQCDFEKFDEKDHVADTGSDL